MSRTLPQLIQDNSAIVSLFLETGGQDNEVLDAWMNANLQDMSEKIDSYRYVMLAIEDHIESFNRRAAEFKDAAKVLENGLDRMKERIQFAMGALGKDELTGNDFRFKLIKNPPKVVIEDEDQIPAFLCNERITFVPDKARIREMIERGETVVGCSVQQGTSVRAYVNTKKVKGG